MCKLKQERKKSEIQTTTPAISQTINYARSRRGNDGEEAKTFYSLCANFWLLNRTNTTTNQRVQQIISYLPKTKKTI